VRNLGPGAGNASPAVCRLKGESAHDETPVSEISQRFLQLSGKSS